MTLIVAKNLELARALRPQIERIAFNPTRDEIFEEMPQIALQILNALDET